MNPRPEMSAGPRHHVRHNYALNPMIVYWEMTQACALACRHCRAEAMPYCHPQELTYDESRDLLRQIAAFGDPTPHLILTGGDPLRRSDLFALIDEATSLGIGVSITPSATEALTPETIGKLRKHGIQSLGLSLDGSTPERHEAVRGVKGCFDWTMRAAYFAANLRMPVQINTLVSEETIDDLPAIYKLLCTVPIMRWSLFFLISVGRGQALGDLSPERGEEVMRWVYELEQESQFAIKTTEAPFYRRVALQTMHASGMSQAEISKSSVYRGFGIRDGHGIVFVSNRGEVYPSGFLPLSAGNVRQDSLVDIYRHSTTFRALHSPELFHGKCGRCEFNQICGGSRARAFAHTGDVIGSDPLCPYQPRREEHQNTGMKVVGQNNGAPISYDSGIFVTRR